MKYPEQKHIYELEQVLNEKSSLCKYKSYVFSIIAQIDDTLIINFITALASLGLHDKALGEFEEANRILPNNDGIIKDMERVKMLLKNREFETDSSEEDF